MKPQGTQSNSLGTQEEFPLKDITSRIISCAIEMHSRLSVNSVVNFLTIRVKI